MFRGPWVVMLSMARVSGAFSPASGAGGLRERDDALPAGSVSRASRLLKGSRIPGAVGGQPLRWVSAGGFPFWPPAGLFFRGR